jgi:hypothetical protein
MTWTVNMMTWTEGTAIDKYFRISKMSGIVMVEGVSRRRHVEVHFFLQQESKKIGNSF